MANIKKQKNSKILLVGLGNPDASYQNTRHNAGYNFLNYLANKYGSEEWKNNKKCLAKINILKINACPIILAKPLVFMNQSGKILNLLKKFYHLSFQHIFIAHDDADIILGDFKIHYGRGSAGHKGIQSIIQSLKSKNFYRIRIGIRSFSRRQKAGKLVLANFSSQEKQILNQIFPIIEEQLIKICAPKNKQKNEKAKPRECLKPKHSMRDN